MLLKDDGEKASEPVLPKLKKGISPHTHNELLKKLNVNIHVSIDILSMTSIFLGRIIRVNSI